MKNLQIFIILHNPVDLTQKISQKDELMCEAKNLAKY